MRTATRYLAIGIIAAFAAVWTVETIGLSCYWVMGEDYSETVLLKILRG